MSQLMLTYPMPTSSNSTMMSQDFSLFLDNSNGKSSNKNTESIHSGHFMVSEIDDENTGLEEKNLEISHESDNEADREENRLPSNIELKSHECTQAYIGQNSNNFVLIDESLSKLFECMSLAYNGKLTSPKWKTFKGLKLPKKDKIRLNNIIWRAWHIQYVADRNPVVCQFFSPVESKRHKQNESIVLEGKYWKRQIEAVKAEYNKWRMFKLGKGDGTTFSPSRPLGSFDWENRLPRWSEDVFIDWNNEWNTDLFSQSSNQSTQNSNLASNNFNDNCGYDFGMRSEFMQPRLQQLQPNVDMMDTFEPIQDYITRFQTTLPTVQEECLPPTDMIMGNNNDFLSANTAYQQQQQPAQMQIQQNNSSFVPNTVISKMDIQTAPQNNNYGFVVQSPQQTTQTQNMFGLQQNTQLVSNDNLLQQQQPQQTMTFSAQLPTPTQATFNFQAPSTSSYGYYSNNQQQQQSQQQQQQQNQQMIKVETNNSSLNLSQQPQQHQSHLQYYNAPAEQNMLVNQMDSLQQTQKAHQVMPFSATTKTLRTRSRSISNSQLQPGVLQQQQQQQQLQQKASTSSLTIKSLLNKPSMLSSGCSEPIDFRQPVVPMSQQVTPTQNQSRTTSQRTTVERSRSLPVYRKNLSKQHQNAAQTHQAPSSMHTQSNESLQGTNHFLQTQRTQPSLAQQSSMLQHFSTESLEQYPQNSLNQFLPQPIDRSNSAVFGDFNKSLPTTQSMNNANSIDNLSSIVFEQSQSQSSLSAFPGTSNSQVFASEGNYHANHSSSSSSPVSFCSSATKKLKCSENSFLPLNDNISLFQTPKSLKSPSPFNSFMPLPVKSEERVLHKERRRVCHINAEQKRRCNIKNGFDTLKNILPSLSASANSKISKAAMLQKAAEYIRVLKNEKFEQQKEYEILKQQADGINHTISLFQSQLPATGAPVSTHRIAQIKQHYGEYVRDRTLQNWKFYIFSILMEKLLDSYSTTVSTGNFDEFYKTIFRWLDQDCSLLVLRKDILDSLRYVSTSTNVLTNPESLQEEILAKVQHKFMSSKDGDSSQGSSSRKCFDNFS